MVGRRGDEEDWASDDDWDDEVEELSDDDEPMVPCPHCGAEILESAFRCEHCENYISPVDSFSILMTLKVPVMVLLGGPGTVFGPVIGSAVFVLMEETIWAKFLDYHQAILGVVIVLLIFFLPGGLLRVFNRRGAA